MSKGKIDLSIKPRSRLLSHTTAVIKGEGSADFHFPVDLVSRALKRAERKKLVIPDSTSLSVVTDHIFGLGGRLWDMIKPATAPVQTDKRFKALLSGADTIQALMVQRQFDAIMEHFLGNMEGTGTWAVNHMDAKFQPAIKAHRRQVGALRSNLEDALPKLLRELSKRHPGVPVSVLLNKALSLIAEELAPIISVLELYTDAFGQYRDGRFARQLRAINLFMEHCFRLFMTGDLEGNNPVSQLPTSAYQVGDVLLAGFVGGSLGTIPGTRGPIGLHLLLVPFDMQDFIPLALPLLAHESRHQIFHDVLNLEQDLQAAVREAILADYKSGKLKLSSEKTRIGRYTVPTVDLIVKLMADTIGEIDADIAGGVLMTGPAYLRSMLLSFPAMLIRTGRVKDAKQLLRTSSVYSMVEQEDGRRTLEFEAHPPDAIRTEIGAAGLELIGYGAQARDIREISLEAVGNMPDYLTWEDSSEKSSTVISIAVEDLRAAAPTVARALIHSSLPSLGGKSTGDRVMWNDNRERKVQLLTDTLLAGKSDLPVGQGSIHAPYVGAAPVRAFWEGLLKGRDSAKMLEGLNENTFTMLEALQALPTK